MAIKKFLMEGQKQVWPITRADCIYTVAGDKLLNVAIEEQHAAMQKAIDDEIARAKAAEKANADTIVAEKERAEGKEGELAQAIADEATARENAVKGVQDQLDALVGDGEGSVADQIADAKADLEGQIDAVEQALADEKNAAKEGSLAKQIADEAARAAGKEGELAQAIADNKDAQDEVNEDFEGRIAANEAFVAAQPAKDLAQDNRLADLEAKFAGDNSVDKKIEAAEAAAKAHAEQKDAALKEELEGKINAKVAQADYDVKMAALDAEDEDIRADFAAADQALQANIDKKVDQSAYNTKVAELAAEDTKIRGDFAAADAQVLADAKAHAEAKDLEDRNAQKLIDDAQDERIKALEDANKEGGAVAEAIAQVAQDLADFEGEQATKEAAQDKAISDEADRAKGEEARIEGLVEAEAERADAEEKRIVGLVEAEAEAARAAEEQLGKDIAAEAQAREAADNALEERVAANEAFVAAQPAIDEAQDDRLEALEGKVGSAAEFDEEGTQTKAATGLFKKIDDKASELEGNIGTAVEGMEAAVAAEKTARENADAAIRNEMAAEATRVNNKIAADIATESALRVAAENALDGRLDVIEGEGEGSIKKAVADEKALREAADTALDGRVQAIEASIGDGGNLEARVAANEDAIEVINGTGEGSIKKAIADLVDGAPEAANTLNELAESIKANKDVYDGWVAQHEKDMAAMKTELQGEIDSDVAAEAGLREAADNKIREDFAAADAQVKADAAADAAAKVAAEAEIARAAEKANADAIVDENERAVAAEEALDARITAIFAAYDGDQEYDDLTPLA